MSHFKVFADKTVMVLKRKILCVYSNNNGEFIILETFEILPDHKSMATIYFLIWKIIPIRCPEEMVWILEKTNLTGPVPQKSEVWYIFVRKTKFKKKKKSNFLKNPPTAFANYPWIGTLYRTKKPTASPYITK